MFVTCGVRSCRAEIDKRDEHGMTALHYACEGESPMSALSLVQAGCDVTTPAGPKGRLPIDFAGSHQLKHVGVPCLLPHTPRHALSTCRPWSKSASR